MLHYFSLLWVHLCGPETASEGGSCVCVCVRVRSGSQKVTHHTTRGVWDPAKLVPAASFPPLRVNWRVTPSTSALLTLRTEGWDAAQSCFLWCFTLGFKVLSIKAEDLGSGPAAARHPVINTHTQTQSDIPFRGNLTSLQGMQQDKAGETGLIYFQAEKKCDATAAKMTISEQSINFSIF